MEEKSTVVRVDFANSQNGHHGRLTVARRPGTMRGRVTLHGNAYRWYAASYIFIDQCWATIEVDHLATTNVVLWGGIRLVEGVHEDQLRMVVVEQPR